MQNWSLFSHRFAGGAVPTSFKKFTAPNDQHGKALTITVHAFLWATEDDMLACARHLTLAIIDGTFQTNDQKLIMLIVAGIDALGKTVAAMYGYIKREGTRPADFSVKAFRLIYGRHAAHITCAVSDGGPALIGAWQSAIAQMYIGFSGMVIQLICFW